MENGNFVKGLMWGIGISVPLWTIAICAMVQLF